MTLNARDFAITASYFLVFIAGCLFQHVFEAIWRERKVHRLECISCGYFGLGKTRSKFGIIQSHHCPRCLSQLRKVNAQKL